MIWVKKHKFHVIIGSIFILFFATHKNWVSWHGKADGPFRHDAEQYYAYLASFAKEYSEEHPYWRKPDDNGYYIPKVTMGVALMESPAFMVAHGISKVLGKEANGFNPIYYYSIFLLILFYVYLGLLYVYKSMLFFFSEWVSLWTSVVLMLGTNLFFYTWGDGFMSHSFLFFLGAVFMYLSLLWHGESAGEGKRVGEGRSPSTSSGTVLSGIGFVIGLAVLIRPTSILWALFFLLWKVMSGKDLKGRIALLWRKRKQIAIAFIISIAVLIPQFFYWHMITGKWVYYTYTKEGFFFLDPKILDFLWSYRKGWFVYSPVLFFALAFGLYGLWKKVKGSILPVYLMVGLAVYVMSSWWTWWFGGGFGSRSMIDYYAFLAFPMAGFLWCVGRSRILKWSMLPLTLFCVILNVVQSNQAHRWSTFHWDSMSKEAYWISFMNINMTKEERVLYEQALIEPDYDAALNGER